ncbi:MAG: HugZ family protein [Nodosilinea sp.]
MANFESVLAAYQTLLSQVQSLMLSTINVDGSPHASYAPYVKDETYQLYIFTSGLSAHTQNLLKTRQASVLLIADEGQTQQVFARQRITYDCQAERLERDTTRWQQIAAIFEQQFGEIIEMLRQLEDFQIFCLSPHRGRFVMGFGAAYEIDPKNLNQLIPQAITSA